LLLDSYPWQKVSPVNGDTNEPMSVAEFTDLSRQKILIVTTTESRATTR
jgi:hypothetical protein